MNGMRPKIYGTFDISNERYHEMPGISRSAISELKKSPLHYYEKYLSPHKPEEKKSSPAMSIGSAVHCLVLEPHNFSSAFSVCTKVDGRSKEGRKYNESFRKLSAGKIILNEEEYKIALNISESILKHPRASSFLAGNISVEKSLFWEDKDSGLVCKARPDLWNKDFNLVCEIKTTRNASEEYFSRVAIEENYHIQAAMQIDAIKAIKGNEIEYFTFIAAPNEPPYMPYVYNMPLEVIEIGRREYKQALMIIKICHEREKWTEDRDSVVELNFNDYLLRSNKLYKLAESYQCQI